MILTKCSAVLLTAIGFVVFVSGCRDGGSKVTTVPVSGTVTLDGEPIEGAVLTFMPQTGGPEKSGYAITDSQGRFEASTHSGSSGLAVGSYRVLAQKLTMPDGSPIPPDASAADVGAVNALPGMYAETGESPLTANIPEGGTPELKFELQSRRR